MAEDEPGPSPPVRERGLERWAPLASALLALGLALAYAFAGSGPGEFCLDDAWIHLAYAKSLGLGDGLSYNPGDWETGFSSPLWVLLLAAWPTEPDPVTSVKLLGALLHAATAGLASAIALDLARQRATVAVPLPALSIAMLAGVLTATAPVLLQGASSGMEIGLTSCLLLASLRMGLREQWLLAAALAVAAELARPEAVLVLAGFGLVLALARRKLAPLAAPLAAAAALGAWVLYCLAVSGWPWPNTAYVKADPGSGERLAGLRYLSEQVFPERPWLAGVGGLALIVAALWTELSGRGVLERRNPEPPVAERRFEVLALLAGWLLALLGTALSRPLDPDILFYQARYFAVFAAIPPIAIAVGVARCRPLLSAVLILPVALLTGLQIPRAQALQRAQERGVALLHRDPAHHVARSLPADAVVAVEGAGALRYHTPRSMHIIDVVGLNDAAIAHAPDDQARACLLIERGVDALVLPEHIAAALGSVFDLRPTAAFVDPDWAQISEPRQLRVFVLEVVAVRPSWLSRCGLDS